MRILGMAMGALLMAASPVSAKGPVAQSEPGINDCDRLAAHPGDPAKIADGVEWDALDAAKAIAACRDASQKWPASARLAYQYGRALMKANQQVDGLKWYRQAVDAGHVRAMVSVGSACQDGDGVAKDPAEAARWYRKAMESGSDVAAFNLALLYRDGNGVPQDKAEAVRLLQTAFDRGYASAGVTIGRAYEIGQMGLETDHAEAVRWYRKAADKGELYAINNLGVMYENGSGGLVTDEKAAMGLYLKAANRGNTLGMRNLASLYARGVGMTEDERQNAEYHRKHGRGVWVSRTDKEADRWYRKAAEAGDKAAREALIDRMLRRLESPEHNATYLNEIPR